MYQFELAVVGTLNQITAFSDWTITDSPILNMFSNSIKTIDSKNRKYIHSYRGQLTSDRLDSWDELISKVIKMARGEFDLDCAYVKIGKTIKDVEKIDGKNIKLNVEPVISSLLNYRGVDKEL